MKRMTALFLAIAAWMPMMGQSTIPNPPITVTAPLGAGYIGPLFNGGALNFPSDADVTASYPQPTAINIVLTSSVSLTATRNLIWPLGLYLFAVKNNTTGGHSVTVIGSSGAGCTVPNGSSYLIQGDGANFNCIGASGSGGNPSVGTNGQIQMADGSGAFLPSAMTDNGTLITSTEPHSVKGAQIGGGSGAFAPFVGGYGVFSTHSGNNFYGFLEGSQSNNGAFIFGNNLHADLTIPDTSKASAGISLNEGALNSGPGSATIYATGSPGGSLDTIAVFGDAIIQLDLPVELPYLTTSTSPLCYTGSPGQVTNVGCSGGGGGAVSSVSNSDSTLTVTPTTGAVVASLALGHANTWTATQTFPSASITNAELANNSITVSGVNIPLGGSGSPPVTCGGSASPCYLQQINPASGSTTTTSSITTGALTVPVASCSVFTFAPGDYIAAYNLSPIEWLVGSSCTGTTLTLSARSGYGTTAVAWASGTTLVQMTRGSSTGISTYPYYYELANGAVGYFGAGNVGANSISYAGPAAFTAGLAAGGTVTLSGGVGGSTLFSQEFNTYNTTNSATCETSGGYNQMHSGGNLGYWTGTMGVGCPAPNVWAIVPGTTSAPPGNSSTAVFTVDSNGKTTANGGFVAGGTVHGLSVPAGTAVAGAANTAVYASDATNGYAEVNENNTGLSRVCTAANGICTGGGATVERVFSAAGTINFTHNLGTTNPVYSCYPQAGGAQTFTVAQVDSNNVAITTAAAADIICAFTYVPTYVPAPDFSFLPSTSSINFTPPLGTGTPTLTVTQSALHSFTGTVTYSVSSSPSGITGTYSPTTITTSGTSTLTTSIPYNQASGANVLTLTGVSGALTHTQPVTVNVATTNNGLLEGWPANEGTGSTIHTITGSSNNLTATAVTWTTPTGFSVPVATFNGTSSIAVGANQTNTNFTNTTPFSVCAWVKLASTSAVYSFVSTMNAAGANYTGWELSSNGTGQFVFFLVSNYGAPNYIQVQTPISSLSTSTAQFVCSTYTGSSAASGVALYINGANMTLSTVSNTLTASIANSNPVTFGSRPAGLNFLSGSLGYVRLYNRVLTSSEVSTLYAAGPQ